MQAYQNAAQAILEAINVSNNPNSSTQQRAEAVNFFEQLKRGDVHATLQAAGAIASSSFPLEAQVVAYSLLNHVVRNRWQELRNDEQAELVSLSIRNVREVASASGSGSGGGGWSLRSQVAALLAGVLRAQGGGGLGALLGQLLQTADEGPAQAEVVCLVLQFVSEDLTQFEEAGGEWKRAFLAALTTSLDEIFPFLYKLLESHFTGAVSDSQAGQRQQAVAHGGVVVAGLKALSMFSEWCPMGRLVRHRMVPAVAFLLNTPDFRLEALEVMKQISGRKKGTEVTETYQELMGAVGLALLAAAQKLLAAEWQQMGPEGEAEEFGKRLCSCMVVHAEGHLACIRTVQDKYALLEQMLRFLSHPHLALAALTLPFWTAVLRDALAAVQNPKKPESAEALEVPTECCRAVIEVLATQIPHVVLHAEEAGEVPHYFDSPSDFKEFTNTFRGQSKMSLRMATQLAPEPALATAGSFLAASLAVAGDEGQRLAHRHVHMESLVFFLESVVSPLSESPLGPSLSESIATQLLQPLLNFNSSDAITLSLLVRGLESFGKFLSLRPDLAVSIVEAAYRLMTSLPLPHPTHQPPPPVLTLAQRTVLMARMCLAKVPIQLAKVCPEAFAPHLQSLVALVQQSAQAGSLTEGERLQFSECILAGACVMGQDTQSQALQWVLSPLHATWTSPHFQQHLASPTAFVQHYMAYRQLPDGSVQLDSREERWTLYHQVVLLERAVRRLPKCGPVREGQPPPPHPFTPHLEWSCFVLARILYCIHGMWAPDMQGALRPLSESFQLDPVERALRMGEDREAAKKELEPDHMAGTTPAGLRSWLRGMREGVLMVLSLLGTHCSPLWTNQQLASALPPVLLSFIEHMEHRHMRVLLRHVILPWLSSCPPHLWRQWLQPLASVLLPHMGARLIPAWAAVTAQQNQGKKENAKEAGDEVVSEALLRDVTREHLTLLQNMTSTAAAINIAAAASIKQEGAERSSANGSAPPSSDGSSPAVVAASTELLMPLLWQADRTAATAAATTAVAALCWPDTESTRRASVVCRFYVQLAEQTGDPQLLSYVGGDMLRATVVSITMVSSVSIQAEVLSLARAILLLCLPKLPATRELLLSLPNVTPQMVEQFSSTLQSQHSEKKQRDAIKVLLLQAGGEALRPLLAVSTVPKGGTVSNVGDPRPQRQAKTPHEEAENEWWGVQTSLQW